MAEADVLPQPDVVANVTDVNMTIEYVRQNFTSRHAALASIYGILFCVGIVGNTWVARVVGLVLFYGRVENVPRSVQMFIFALCLSDIIILISMSLTLMDLLLGQWIFGQVLCTCFVCLDMVNKFFAPFLLAVLSSTCYTSICRADSTQWMRSSGFALTATAFSLLSALILASPAFIYADVIEYELNPLVRNGGFVQPRVRKCGFLPTPMVATAFTSYGTVLGYLLPMLSFCYFYAKVALFVRRHSRNTPLQNTVPFWRVGKVIIALVLVYVCCWTPFWVGTWIVSLFEMTNVQIMIMYLTHLLPYVSCTAYPIIYTLMNRGIQDAHARIAAQQKRRLLSNADTNFTLETGLLHPELSGSRLSFRSLRNSLRSQKSNDFNGATRSLACSRENLFNGSLSLSPPETNAVSLNTTPVLKQKNRRSAHKSSFSKKANGTLFASPPVIDVNDCDKKVPDYSSCNVFYESTL